MAGKGKRGPESEFKQEYCQQIVDLMGEGKSKEKACIEMGIGRTTFYRYQENFPEFAEAVKEGEFANKAWWTELGRNASIGQVADFNATAWIFNMKNQHGWRDKQDLAIGDPDGKPLSLTVEFVEAKKDKADE